MNRKIKALGLALMAALALTAVMASTASAQFTYSQEHMILSGSPKAETNHTFNAGSGFGTISCATASFSGTAFLKSEMSQVAQPTYTGCKDSSGRTVDVDNSNLTYTFTPGGEITTINKEGKVVGTDYALPKVHISGGLTLTITSGGSVVCTVTFVSPQTNNGISYKNLGGGGIEVFMNITTMKSTVEGGFFNCGTSTTNATAGTYTGTSIVTGKTTGGSAAELAVDIAHSYLST